MPGLIGPDAMPPKSKLREYDELEPSEITRILVSLSSIQEPKRVKNQYKISTKCLEKIITDHCTTLYNYLEDKENAQLLKTIIHKQLSYEDDIISNTLAVYSKEVKKIKDYLNDLPEGKTANNFVIEKLSMMFNDTLKLSELELQAAERDKIATQNRLEFEAQQKLLTEASTGLTDILENNKNSKATLDAMKDFLIKKPIEVTVLHKDSPDETLYFSSYNEAGDFLHTTAEVVSETINRDGHFHGNTSVNDNYFEDCYIRDIRKS